MTHKEILMSKNIWRPLNTYGLVGIGAVVSAVIIYVVVTL